VLVVIAWFAGPVIGFLIGSGRGRAELGGVLGFLLGPIGWAVVAAFSDVRPRCPECEGVLPSRNVSRCKHCTAEISVEADPHARTPSSLRGKQILPTAVPIEAPTAALSRRPVRNR